MRDVVIDFNHARGFAALIKEYGPTALNHQLRTVPACMPQLPFPMSVLIDLSGDGSERCWEMSLQELVAATSASLSGAPAVGAFRRLIPVGDAIAPITAQND